MQPIICAINGVAAGAGLALALASDIRIALYSTQLVASFVRLGLTGTDMGTSFYLPRVAGLGIASEMLLTGRPLSSERAYQVGLINHVAQSSSELMGKALEYAQDMLSLSYRGLMLTKEQLNSVADSGSLRAALTAENSHQIMLVNDPKASEMAEQWVRKLLKPQRARL